MDSREATLKIAELSEAVRENPNPYKKQSEERIEENNISWENALEEYAEKKLEAITSEVETLEDTKEKESHQLNLEMNKTMEIINDDKKIQAVRDILSLYEEIMEIGKSRVEIEQKRSEAQKTLRQIRQECANIEKLIVVTKDESEERVQNLTEGIKLKHKLLEEKSSELRSCEAEIDDYNKKIEENATKSSSIDEAITSLQQISTRLCYDPDEAKEDMKKITQETERLKEESDNLETATATIEENHSKKQKELDKLKTTPNLEILEMKEQIAVFEAEKTKITQTAQIISLIEQEIKSLSQTIEQQQTALQDYTSRKIELENRKKLKNITKQLEDSEEEVQHMEASKRGILKMCPKPPAKRTHKPPETDPNSKSDSESDSSSKYMSYAEFMAKQRRLPKKKEGNEK